MITQKEIAEKLGISRTTVARAINGSPLIKEETKRKVMKLIKEMNYEKNIVGSSLAIKKTKQVYCLVIKSKNEFYTQEIIRGLLDAGKEFKPYGLRLKIIESDINDSESQLKELEKILFYDDIDGLIITPLEKNKAYEMIKPHLERIKVVSLGIRLGKEIYHVGPDHVKQGKIAACIMNSLLRKGEKLLIIDNGDDKISSKEYIEGFIKTAQTGEAEILGPLDGKGIENSVELIKKMCEENDIKGIYMNRYAHDTYAEIPINFLTSKKIVTNGISREIKKMIKNGIITATVMEEIAAEGYASARKIFDLLYKCTAESETWEISKSHIIFLENLND